MNHFDPKRSSRLARITKIAQAVARVSENEVFLRTKEVASQEARLDTIVNYQNEYASSARSRELNIKNVGLIKISRQFGWWLTDLAAEQALQLDQAKYILEAARSAAFEKRQFADALEKVSTRAAQADLRHWSKIAQDELDDIAARMQP